MQPKLEKSESTETVNELKTQHFNNLQQNSKHNTSEESGEEVSTKFYNVEVKCLCLYVM